MDAKKVAVAGVVAAALALPVAFLLRSKGIINFEVEPGRVPWDQHSNVGFGDQYYAGPGGVLPLQPPTLMPPHFGYRAFVPSSGP